MGLMGLGLGLVKIRVRVSKDRVRVRIAIMHIVLRCRTGSLSSCAELDSGFEAVFRSFPLGLGLGLEYGLCTIEVCECHTRVKVSCERGDAWE